MPQVQTGAGAFRSVGAKPCLETPLRGFYDFVRSHLAVFNGLVLTAGSLVGALNFLIPGFKAVPLLLYSMVAVLAAVMVVAGFAPSVIARATRGRAGSPEEGGSPGAPRPVNPAFHRRLPGRARARRLSLARRAAGPSFRPKRIAAAPRGRTRMLI